MEKFLWHFNVSIHIKGKNNNLLPSEITIYVLMLYYFKSRITHIVIFLLLLLPPNWKATEKTLNSNTTLLSTNQRSREHS